MPTFSSAQVTDPFLSTGELLAPMAAFDTHQNQLYKQQSDQQQIGLTDMATVARAAAPLLGMSETDAAAAYPGIVADLQRQGFAKQAPSTYPGHAVTQSLVQRGMTVPEQIQGGFVTAPGVTDALKAAVAPLSVRGDGSGGGGSVSGPPDPNTPAGAVAQRTATFWAAKGYTPEQVAGIMAAGPGAESSFVPGASGDGGTSYGLYQHHADRLDALKARYGANPTEAQQNEYAAWEISPDGPYASVGAQLKQAKTPQEAAAIWTKGFESPANADAKAVARAAVAPRYVGYGLPAPKVAVTAPQPGFAPVVPVSGAPTLTGQADDAALAPVAQTKTATRLDGTDVAGPPGVVPDTTLPPIPAPHQLYQTGLPGVTISGPPSNTLAPPSVAAQAAPPQPVAQSQPPIAQPPTAPAQAQPRTGQNSPQFQAAMELNRRAQALDMVVDPTGRTKALAASLRAQAALYMQADSVVQTPEGQLHTLTGKLDDPAKPLANFMWNQERKAFVDTGGHYPPVTPRPGSITVLPDGRVYQSDPGGGVTDITRTDPAGIAARKAAEAQGTQAGTASGKLPTELANQGAEATRAISTLDEGAHNIALAKQGGINPGYFAPWLTGVASMAKSIGGDEGTKLLGIDPSAVGDIQTARKTLAIVSSSILKQALGDSQITDAKIEHFIHAQPGIETDPDALIRVMNWARSQFVYEREMAAQAMEDTSPETGTLPLNWKQKYYSKHGFGPIYNPEVAQMQQPDGQTPPREPPSTRAAAPDALASARAAISQGAPRDAVIKRLRDNGIDPGGL